MNIGESNISTLPLSSHCLTSFTDCAMSESRHFHFLASETWRLRHDLKTNAWFATVRSIFYDLLLERRCDGIGLLIVGRDVLDFPANSPVYEWQTVTDARVSEAARYSAEIKAALLKALKF